MSANRQSRSELTAGLSRLRREWFLDRARTDVFVAGLGAGGLTLAAGLWGLWSLVGVMSLVLAGLTCTVTGLILWKDWPGLAETARRVDQESGLADRVSSAYAFRDTTDPMTELLIADAVQRLPVRFESRAPRRWLVPYVVGGALLLPVVVLFWNWTGTGSAFRALQGPVAVETTPVDSSPMESVAADAAPAESLRAVQANAADEVSPVESETNLPVLAGDRAAEGEGPVDPRLEASNRGAPVSADAGDDPAANDDRIGGDAAGSAIAGSGAVEPGDASLAGTSATIRDGAATGGGGVAGIAMAGGNGDPEAGSGRALDTESSDRVLLTVSDGRSREEGIRLPVGGLTRAAAFDNTIPPGLRRYIEEYFNAIRP